MDTAPFYGAKNTGYVLCTMDGININTYPNLSTGMACGRTVTFGYLLGKVLSDAAEHAADVVVKTEE